MLSLRSSRTSTRPWKESPSGPVREPLLHITNPAVVKPKGRSPGPGNKAKRQRDRQTKSQWAFDSSTHRQPSVPEWAEVKTVDLSSQSHTQNTHCFWECVTQKRCRSGQDPRHGIIHLLYMKHGILRTCKRQIVKQTKRFFVWSAYMIGCFPILRISSFWDSTLYKQSALEASQREPA